MFKHDRPTVEPELKAHRRTSRDSGVKLTTWFIILILVSFWLPQTLAVPECHGKLDAVFLLDVSNSITDTSLDSVRSLVEYMVNSFNESIPGSLRMSVVWYAEIIYPTDRSLTGNLEMALSNMNSFDRYSDPQQMNFEADTALALNEAQEIFKDGDNEATWFTILITDSFSSDETATKLIAEELETTKIHVLPFGFGLMVTDKKELTEIATANIPVVTPVANLPTDTSTLAGELAAIVCEVTRTEQALNVPKVNLPVDIYFALEGLKSGQSGADNHIIMKDFVKMVVRGFEIGDASAKVSWLNYGQQILPDYVFPLEPRSESDLIAAINDLAYNPNNDGRDLNAALVEITESINTNAKPNRPVSIVILSTGLSENGGTGALNGNEAILKAQALKDRVNPNVDIIVIAVADSETDAWAAERSAIASTAAALPLIPNFTTLTSGPGVPLYVQTVKNLIVQFASRPLSKQFDLVFATDGSGMVSEFDSSLFKLLLQSLVDSFDVESGNVRVGLIVYDASGVYSTMHLGSYSDKDDLFRQIDATRYLHRTETPDNAIGIAAIRDEFAANSRQNPVAKIGWLITKGPSPYGMLVQVHARAAAEEGIELLFLGVGQMVDMPNLMAIQTSFQAFYNADPAADPPFVRFSHQLQLGSEEMLTSLKEDVDHYAGIIHPAGFLFPWDTVFDIIVLVHDDAGRVNIGLGTKEFLRNLLLKFRVENDKARVGVITFGSDVNRGDNQMIELEDRDNPGVLQAAITLLDLVPTNGLNIPAAIDEMIAMFDRNPRPNVAKLALLIAGGFAGAPDVTLEDINKIKDAEILMVTLGVGGETNEIIMDQLAYNPQLSYMQTAWDELTVTERMIADINALALNEMFVSDLDKRPLSLSTQCSHPAGIAILIDTSGSIKPILEKVKRFIGILISGFDLSMVDVGMFAYGLDVHVDTIIQLGTIKNYAELYFTLLMKIQAIDDLGTRTDLAIKFMREEMFDNPSYGKQKIAIVVSDGLSDIPQLTQLEAQRARAEGIEMIAFGVNDGTFINELQGITGNLPDALFLFTDTDFADDEKLKLNLESAANFICNISKPAVNCSPGTLYDSNTNSCLECERGTYQELYNETSCTACHAGLTTSGTGASTMEACIDPCDSGKTWDGSACVACGLGKYRDKAQHNLCVDCPKMHTTLTLDKTGVTDTAVGPDQCAPDCTAGFKWNIDETICVPCPLDTYQPAPYQYDCLPCPAGQVASMGSLQCIPGSRLCGAVMDLVLIVDTVPTIDEASFDLVKSSLKAVINSLEIAPDKTRVGVIPSALIPTISTIPPVLHLNDTSMSQGTVHSAVDSLELSVQTGQREMALSLMTAIKLIETQGRVKIPKMILMAVYGESQNQHQVKLAAAVAEHYKIHIFTLGFGPKYANDVVSDPALEELEFLAKDGNSMFRQPDFTDIASSDLSKAICEVATKNQFTTAPVTDNLCVGGSLDMMVMLDLSGSLNNNKINLMLAILQVVSKLNEANIASRIAVISFDSDVNTNLALSFSSSVSGYGDISQALDRQTGDGTGGTATGEAIQEALSVFQTDGNPSAQYVLLTFIDEASSDTTLTMQQAELVHENYIYSMVVEIGSNGNDAEIKALATNLDAIFRYDTAGDLLNAWIADAAQVVDRVCITDLQGSCPFDADIHFVYDLDDQDLMVSAMGMAENLFASFSNMVQFTVTDHVAQSDDYPSLGEAVTVAQIEVEGNTVVAQIIIILTDRDDTANADIVGLQAATDNAKRAGIIVGVINANPTTSVDWHTFVSDEKAFIQLDVGTAFDDVRYARFIPPIFCIDQDICHRAMDLVFLVDNINSDAIDDPGFLKIKEFLQNLVQSLDVSTGQIRVGLVQIGSPVGIPLTLMPLNDPDMSLESVNAGINSLALENMPRDTATALNYVLFGLFGPEGRAGIPRVMMVITHGPSVNQSNTKYAAATLASQGIDIISVGVGPSVDTEELVFMAKDASSVVQSTFDGLLSQDLSAMLCEGACQDPGEIAVLMDVTSAMTETEKDAMKNALKSVVAGLDIAPTGIRVGIASFDNTVNTPTLTLDDSVDLAAVNAAIDAQDGGGTGGSALGAALLEGLNLLQSSRPGLPQTLITVTVGGSSNIMETMANAQSLYDSKIYSLGVGLGVGLEDEEILAIATDPGAVFTYSSAEAWNNNATAADDLLARICPTENQCLSPVVFVFIWDIGLDIGSKDVLVSAFRFQQNLLLRFPGVPLTAVFSQNYISLGDTVTAAQTMLGGPELLKIIIIMTNQNVADISALQTATDTAKDSGIVVVVLNANQLTNVIWSDYATSYEDTFQPEPFSMQNARFIYDRLCRACPTGTKRNADGVCEPCPAGSVGTGIECQSCPEGKVQPATGQPVCESCPEGSQPNVEQTQCEEISCVEPMDVVLLVDIDQNILPEDFIKVKEFLVNLINRLSIAQDRIRVAVASIGDQTVPEDVPSLNPAMSKQMVIDTILALSHNANDRDMASAVSSAREILVQEGRDNVAQIIFIVAYGQSIIPWDTMLEKAEAINARIEIAAVGMGAAAVNELQELVTKPELLFKPTDFASLPDLEVEVWTDLCNVATEFDPETPLPQLTGACPYRQDIVILWDASSSFSGLGMVRIALAMIVGQLQDIDLDKIRVGLVSFANSVNVGEILFLDGLDGSTNEALVISAIGSQPDPVEDGSALSAGLMKALELFDVATQRLGIPRRLVVVTDGVSTDLSTLSDSIAALQKKAIYAVVVGVGLTSTDPSNAGEVITDPALVSGPLKEIATETESIVLYETAEQFMVNVKPVLDAICPDDLLCDSQLEMVTIRNIENLEVLVSSLNFRDQMRERFPALNDGMEIDASPSNPLSKPLDEAIQIARLHLMQNEILAQLENFGISSITKRGVPGIPSLPPDVTRVILIITDLPLEDGNGTIMEASLAARQDGIIVTVINAAPDPGPNSPWLSITSSIDNLFEVDPAYSWFIQKGLCFADCLSGSEISVEGKCIPCEQGSYRNSSEEYNCQLCPEPRTTPSVGATDVSQCTICPAGMELTEDECVACKDGFIQPSPSSNPCQECTDPNLPHSTQDRTQCSSDCPDGQVWNKNSASCSICLAGTYKPGQFAEKCNPCPEGTTSVDGADQCFPMGSFSFGADSYTVQEGGVVELTVIFTPTFPEKINELIENSPGVLTGVAVAYQIQDGSAQAGTDYEIPEEQICEFPVGVYEKTISIQILDDDSPEQDETFTITLTTPGFVLGLSCPSEPCVLGMEVGDPSAVTVTIEDNEPVPLPTVKFDQSSYSVLEGDGIVEVTIVMDLTTLEGLSFLLPNVSVTVGTSDGTAVAGSNYVAKTETLEIDPNMEETSRTVTIHIINNSEATGDQQFSVLLTNPSAAILGDPNTVVVTIKDDDQAVQMAFSFDTATYTASAIDDMVIVTVNLDMNTPAGVSPVFPDSVSVTVTTMAGTAVSGVNFIPTTVDCEFDLKSEERTKTVTIRLLGNELDRDVGFTVTMSTSSAGTTIGSPNTATVIIQAAAEPGGCEPCVDLVIAVDMSRNSGGSECVCLKTFLSALIDRLTISKTCTRTGIIKFAKSSMCVINLKDGYSDRRVRYQIGKHMRRVSSRHNANACSALNTMYTMFGKERRGNVPHKGLLIMDQTSDNTAAAMKKANLLKSKGVDLTVIGTDTAEVDALASPVSGFVITDYCNLPSIDDVVDTFC